MAYVPRKDSDQPGELPSLISLSYWPGSSLDPCTAKTDQNGQMPRLVSLSAGPRSAIGRAPDS